MDEGDIIKHFTTRLYKELPLDNPMFFGMAKEANLFPLNYSNHIAALGTRADKVLYFLQNVIEPYARVFLPKLLKVMMNSKVANLEILAQEIQAKLGKYIQAVEQGKSKCFIYERSPFSYGYHGSLNIGCSQTLGSACK